MLGVRIKKALCGLEAAERALTDSSDGSQALREQIHGQLQRLRCALTNYVLLNSTFSVLKIYLQQLRCQKSREKLAQIAGQKEVVAHDAAQRLADSGGGSRVPATLIANHWGADVAFPAAHVGAQQREQRVHNLILGKDFHYYEKGDVSDDGLVHTRDFWGSLEKDLSANPPSFTRVLVVLAEIRKGIENFAVQCPQALAIVDIIDVVFIEEQLTQNSLDFKSCERLGEASVAVIIIIMETLFNQSGVQCKGLCDTRGCGKRKRACTCPPRVDQRRQVKFYFFLCKIHLI